MNFSKWASRGGYNVGGGTLFSGSASCIGVSIAEGAILGGGDGRFAVATMLGHGGWMLMLIEDGNK